MAKKVMSSNKTEYILVPVNWLAEKLVECEEELKGKWRFPMFRNKFQGRMAALTMVAEDNTSIPSQYIDKALDQYRIDSNPVTKTRKK